MVSILGPAESPPPPGGGVPFLDLVITMISRTKEGLQAAPSRVLSEMHCTTRRGSYKASGARRVRSVRRVVQGVGARRVGDV